MLASLLLLFVVGLMCLPGVVLGHGATPLSSKMLLRIFLGNVLVFTLMSLVFKLWPLLFDPRAHLW